jgi:hypothetical protein
LVYDVTTCCSAENIDETSVPGLESNKEIIDGKQKGKGVTK